MFSCTHVVLIGAMLPVYRALFHKSGYLCLELLVLTTSALEWFRQSQRTPYFGYHSEDTTHNNSKLDLQWDSHDVMNEVGTNIHMNNSCTGVTTVNVTNCWRGSQIPLSFYTPIFNWYYACCASDVALICCEQQQCSTSTWASCLISNHVCSVISMTEASESGCSAGVSAQDCLKWTASMERSTSFDNTFFRWDVLVGVHYLRAVRLVV